MPRLFAQLEACTLLLSRIVKVQPQTRLESEFKDHF